MFRFISWMLRNLWEGFLDFIDIKIYQFTSSFGKFIKRLRLLLSSLRDLLDKRYDLEDYIYSIKNVITTRKNLLTWRLLNFIIFSVILVLLVYFASIIGKNYLDVWNQLSEKSTETALIEQLKSLVAVGSSLLIFVGTIGSIYWTYRNIKASLDKQITDRFTAAIDQLKSDEPAVQLGGIYALETISKESDQYYWTIMEILVSLIKYESSKFEKKIEEEKNSKHNKKKTLLILKDKILEEEINPKIPIVVQAALNVICRRDTRREYRDQILDLSHCYLCQANLKRAQLKNAILKFSKLNGAELQEANLSGAKLQGAKLQGAKLDYANLDQAFFQGAILQEADLTGCSTIETKFMKADLSNADLTNTNLKLANLSDAILISIKGFGSNVDFYTSLDGATYDDKTEMQIIMVKSDFNFNKKGMKKIGNS